jgi:hypothetical protein
VEGLHPYGARGGGETGGGGRGPRTKGLGSPTSRRSSPAIYRSRTGMAWDWWAPNGCSTVSDRDGGGEGHQGDRVKYAH